MLVICENKLTNNDACKVFLFFITYFLVIIS